MLPLAHTAAAVLANRLAGTDRGVAPSLAGALLPDAIDKGANWVLRLTPSARFAGHSPLVALALTGSAAGLFGRRAGAAFGVAYASHLVTDLWDGGHIPWLWPVRRYDNSSRPWHVELKPADLALEALGAAYLLLLARRSGG